MEIDQENQNSKKLLSYKRIQCFRDLLNRLEGLEEKEDTGLYALKELGDVLKEVKEIDRQCPFESRVEYSDETLLEHVVLSSTSNVLLKCIENVDIFTSTYEPAEFTLKMIDHIKENEDFKSSDWLNILEDARKVVPTISKYSFLYGTFDPTKVPEPQQRKERNKRDAQENVQKVQLQRVHNLQSDEEGKDDTLSFIANVLTVEYEKNNSEPISYLDFVVDSKDFSKTIENIFYTSFLIRDGKVQLDIKNNLATIKPRRKRDLKEFRSKNGKNTQMITSLTMEDWEELRSTEGYIQAHRKLLKSKT